MYRYSLAALGLSAVILSLYIFSYAKKLKTLSCITSFMIMPLEGLYAVLFLIDYIPDSLNLGILTFISFFCASISVILFHFEDKSFFRLVARIFFLISQLCWLEFYYSSFMIYKIPRPAFILGLIFYASLLITIYIFVKSRRLSYYFWTGISLFVTTALLFTALITLCMSRKIYALVLFNGALISEFTAVYYLLQIGKFNFKHGNFTRLIAFFLSQILFASTGNILFFLN